MKAVQFAAYGTPDVLYVVDVEVPEPEATEILIRVASAGINPLDTKIRSGAMAAGSALGAPSGTGLDAAGTVLRIGTEVTDVAVGDSVFGTGRNTLAEQAVLSHWAKIPEGVDPVDAGGWGVATETAHRLLTDLDVHRGTILLSGASGGVGSALIQLARSRGLHVVGTASVRNHAYLEGLGAIPVTYGPGLVERVRAVAPEGVDGALDLSGSGVIGDLIALVGDPRKVISISDFTAPALGARVSTGATRTTNPKDGFAEAAALPGFSLSIQHRYALGEASAAHAESEQGHTVGKLIVVP